MAARSSILFRILYETNKPKRRLPHTRRQKIIRKKENVQSKTTLPISDKKMRHTSTPLLLEGHCIEGTIQSINAQTFSLLCNQPIIRAREGDSLSLRTNPQGSVSCAGKRMDRTGYIVSLRKNIWSSQLYFAPRNTSTPASMGWNFCSTAAK